ncbi:MAG: ABC transporter permease subunit [Planctomycetota bacterium]|nr:ABC transporter permease subunit [Planctomycetota bacterium]
MSSQRTFTGRSRERSTRRSVRFADHASRFLITIGGIGTIVAVVFVCAFLAYKVLPLFLPADVEYAAGVEKPAGEARRVVHAAVDEYLTIVYVCLEDATVVSYRADDWSELRRFRLFEDRTPTAWSFSSTDETALVGFADGSVQPCRFRFETEFLSEDRVPESLYALGIGEEAPYREGMVQVTREGQFRLQTLTVETVGDPASLGDGPVRRLDHLAEGGRWVAAALLEAPGGGRSLVYASASESQDMMTGRTRVRFRAVHPLPYTTYEGGHASFVRVASLGALVYAAWPDGRLVRIRTTDPAHPFVAEELDVVEDPGATLTSLQFLLGRETLLAGDSTGRVQGWFAVSAEDRDGARQTPDGFVLDPARRFSDASDETAVTALGSGTRRRIFVAGHDSGAIGVFYATAETKLLTIDEAAGSPVRIVTVSPKEDAIVAVTGEAIHRWNFDPRYPEANAKLLFTAVQYEGYAEEDFMWQSSAATDAAEPKLNMIPLIFGTIKATFYSMIFGAPLALLAAIYTSEFLDPKLKALIKPSIEMMASLPSVVLGFLAALVFAPVVERFIPAVLAAFVALPLAVLVGALIWQIIPRRITLRMQRFRIFFIFPAIPLGIILAAWLGPPVEGLLFGGNIRAWLNGLHLRPAVGHPWGGWFLLLLPLGALVVAVFTALRVEPWIRRRTSSLDRRRMAWIDLAKFAGGCVVTVALVIGLSLLLSALGLDLRKPLPVIGPLVDTYDQRNALVVGFVMGFAIIPIIYTLADDALSTVPEHLRGASLGAGATPWQTTVRIVVPTAMSGLFSALMIGMGRAVGETMIVLMAAGNTPVMSMNVFEGFRTLAANLAVELQEAPKDGMHYRVLFLTALALFAMTFVVNTIAEAVRLRFRRRAYQL